MLNRRQQGILGSTGIKYNADFQKIFIKHDLRHLNKALIKLRELSLQYLDDEDTFSNFINFQDESTGTSLLHAAIIGRLNISIIRFLLFIGVKPNILDATFNTALHTCVMMFEKDLDIQPSGTDADKLKEHFNDTLERISILIAGGADPTIRNEMNVTPFQYLAQVVSNLNEEDSKLLKRIKPTMKTLSQTYMSVVEDIEQYSYTASIINDSDFNKWLLKTIGIENFKRYSNVKILDFKSSKVESTSNCIAM